MMPLDLSVLTDLESNEEKYSLSVTGKNWRFRIWLFKGLMIKRSKWKNLIYWRSILQKLKSYYCRCQSCFGGSHPFTDSNLPAHTQELVDVTKIFSWHKRLRNLKVCFFTSLSRVRIAAASFWNEMQ
jgi:hypothetical protein